MAKFTVNVDQFQELANREQVLKGLLEGRIIPPVLKDVSRGETVDLDPDDEHTKNLLDLGSIQKPGGGLSSLKKDELEALADQHGVDLSAASNNDERVAALQDAGVTADSS